MPLEEFYQCTIRELSNKIEGHRRRLEQMHRAEWERARFIAYYAIAPYLKKHGDNSMQRVIPLPWDNEAPKPIKITKEKEEELHALLDKIPFPN